QVDASLGAHSVRVQGEATRVGELAAGGPQPANLGPLQADLAVRVEILLFAVMGRYDGVIVIALQEDFAIHDQIVAVDAATRRVVEAPVTAIDIALNMRRTQAHLAFGMEVRSIHEERPADPHIPASDGLASLGHQVTVGQAQVTPHIRPVQGDYAG